MKTSKIGASFVAFFAFGGVALAAATDASVSGLWPLGDAQLGPVVDQRLVVTNLGSSGEDGVQLGASSAFGDGFAVDTDALLNTPGATCHIEQNGKEGVSHGSLHILSHGEGDSTLTFDYSGLGVTAVRVVEYDELNTVVSDELHDGSIWERPGAPDNTCPDGSAPSARYVWMSHHGCASCPGVSVLVWICPDIGVFSYSGRIVVTPVLPPDDPEIDGVESVSITSSGIPELTISEVDSAAFDALP